MLSSRKKRPLVRDERVFRDTRLLIIATEGSKTEKIYFEQFGDSRVQVRVIESSDGRSSPEHVLSNLDEFASFFAIGQGDSMWVVIDRDRWKVASLSVVASKCKSKGYGFAVSNPCFELWLAYHFDDPLPQNITAASLKKHLKKVMGTYNKNKFDCESLMERVGEAVHRAREMDLDIISRWPNKIGTRVYKVVESLKSVTTST